MSISKNYNDTKYKGRAQKEACQGKLENGEPCPQKRIRGKSFCGHCLERQAAEEQRQHEQKRQGSR